MCEPKGATLENLHAECVCVSMSMGVSMEPLLSSFSVYEVWPLPKTLKPLVTGWEEWLDAQLKALGPSHLPRSQRECHQPTSSVHRGVMMLCRWAQPNRRSRWQLGLEDGPGHHVPCCSCWLTVSMAPFPSSLLPFSFE